jgi:hypothetical protein
MISLGNISNFNNTNDYLPIITSALIIDLVIILMVLFKKINSKSLNSWYNKFGPSAVLADVFSIVIGIILARFVYLFIFKEYSLIKFLFLTIIIQIIHDLSLGLFINSIPRGNSSIFDVFKDYALENGLTILMVDALMMISTIILASYLTTFKNNNIIIILISMLYITPYLLFSLKQ